MVKELVSGLFNACYAIGGVTGPIFGGYLNTATNFRTVNDAWAIILITLAIF